MRKYLCLIVLALGVGLGLLLTGGGEPAQPRQLLSTPSPPRGCRVLLNGYAPEEWNGGFGHYDLSFLAPEGEAIRYRLGDQYVECSELTLSYGPMGGDNSPARVNLYPQPREDHIPRERLVVYDGLRMADFHTFMGWFSGEFAVYNRTAEQHHVFCVTDESYAVYSLAGEKTCLTAALHILGQLPGAHDERRNPCAALVERLEMSLR